MRSTAGNLSTVAIEPTFHRAPGYLSTRDDPAPEPCPATSRANASVRAPVGGLWHAPRADRVVARSGFRSVGGTGQQQFCCLTGQGTRASGHALLRTAFAVQARPTMNL